MSSCRERLRCEVLNVDRDWDNILWDAQKNKWSVIIPGAITRGLI